MIFKNEAKSGKSVCNMQCKIYKLGLNSKVVLLDKLFDKSRFVLFVFIDSRFWNFYMINLDFGVSTLCSKLSLL